jgi:DNA-directed RNA polymerase specialized sigma24 family protein
MNREKFFGEAYVKWFRRTEAVLRLRGANPDLARELAQASWAKAWQCLLQLGDDRRILQFVNTIAIRLFLDEVARSRRMTELPSDAVDLKFSLATTITEIDLQNALRKILPRQRALLETVYLHEGRPTASIACALGTSLDALHHRVSRARQSLRKAMDAV